jgi:dephospho-CoA kinase
MPTTRSEEPAEGVCGAAPVGLVIGVTGGIGSGKSTAARLFRERGADLLDTDALAHELTRAGQPGLLQIAERFGRDVLAADGSLDRATLRSRVFSDPAARRELEAILHPLIRREVEARVRACAGPYALVLIPLLVETGGYPDLLDRVLVVDCNEEIQVQRTMQRGGITEPEVRSIMQTQASRDARLTLADDVIHNDGDLAELARQVEALDGRYRALARVR